MSLWRNRLRIVCYNEGLPRSHAVLQWFAAIVPRRAPDLRFRLLRNVRS